MFKCDKCGECCRNLAGNKLYRDLDRGDGICRFLNGNLCTIYNRRPLKCNIDKTYNMFFSEVCSRENFYELNERVCTLLKNKKYRNKIMYLKELKVEEKQAFLLLAYSIAEADGIYADEEQILMSAYANECGIPFKKPDNPIEIQDVLSSFEDSSERTKRIILLEIIAMALVDTKYEDEEKAIIEKIASSFSISNAETDKAVNICNNYLIIGRAINSFIEKGE